MIKKRCLEPGCNKTLNEDEGKRKNHMIPDYAFKYYRVLTESKDEDIRTYAKEIAKLEQEAIKKGDVFGIGLFCKKHEDLKSETVDNPLSKIFHCSQGKPGRIKLEDVEKNFKQLKDEIDRNGSPLNLNKIARGHLDRTSLYLCKKIMKDFQFCWVSMYPSSNGFKIEVEHGQPDSKSLSSHVFLCDKDPISWIRSFGLSDKNSSPVWNKTFQFIVFGADDLHEYSLAGLLKEAKAPIKDTYPTTCV